MARDIKSEIEDILSLSRNVNTDIQKANKDILDPYSKLKMGIVNPKAAVESLIQTAGQNIPAEAIRQAINPAPTAVANYDGMAVEVSAPRGLIPMPEGYAVPPAYQQPVPQYVARPNPHPQIQQAPSIPQNIITEPPDAVQLEFDLALDSPQNKPIIDEIYLKFKRIEDKIDIMNSKINELVSIERKKYERRAKKLSDGFGESPKTSTNA